MRLARFSSIEIINPGVTHSDYKKMKKSSYFSLLYLGRLKPYKNVDVALRAFANILEKRKDAVFYIAGVGESLKDLQKLATELDISESVKFLGRVTEDEKTKLLSSVWVMVQPSMIEGWGITVIEANASGTPVVASDVNGLKDSISDAKTGLLFKVKNPSDLEEKINKMIKNQKTLKTFSDNAYVWSKKFSWQTSAERFLVELEIATSKDLSLNKKLINISDDVSEQYL